MDLSLLSDLEDPVDVLVGASPDHNVLSPDTWHGDPHMPCGTLQSFPAKPSTSVASGRKVFGSLWMILAEGIGCHEKKSG